MDFQEIVQKIRPILQNCDVEYAGLFGSHARGEAKENSDVDILVKFSGRPTFSAYLHLDESLRVALGREIDLLTEGGINKFLRPHIERDLKIFYGQR
jgi:predicted nucleotidyltransferase